MKVLIIEDEKAMSDLVALKFKVEGIDVEQAFTFTEAKTKIVQNGPFSAILTDFLLPDGELVDFLKVVRSNPQIAGIPVVVMTNYVEDINADQLKSLGVLDILVKYQVVPAQMVEKIKSVVGGGVNEQPVPANSN